MQNSALPPLALVCMAGLSAGRGGACLVLHLFAVPRTGICWFRHAHGRSRLLRLGQPTDGPELATSRSVAADDPRGWVLRPRRSCAATIRAAGRNFPGQARSSTRAIPHLVRPRLDACDKANRSRQSASSTGLKRWKKRRRLLRSGQRPPVLSIQRLPWRLRARLELRKGLLEAITTGWCSTSWAGDVTGDLSAAPLPEDQCNGR